MGTERVAQIAPGTNPEGCHLVVACSSGNILAERALPWHDVEVVTDEGVADRTASLAHLRSHGCAVVSAAVYDGLTGHLLGYAELNRRG